MDQICNRLRQLIWGIQECLLCIFVAWCKPGSLELSYIVWTEDGLRFKESKAIIFLAVQPQALFLRALSIYHMISSCIKINHEQYLGGQRLARARLHGPGDTLAQAELHTAAIDKVHAALCHRQWQIGDRALGCRGLRVASPWANSRMLLESLTESVIFEGKKSNFISIRLRINWWRRPLAALARLLAKPSIDRCLIYSE